MTMKTLASLTLVSLFAMTAVHEVSADDAKQNKAVIQASFDAWRAGTGGPFALLAPDATWTIPGNSHIAKRYGTRDEFLDSVIKPFNARMTKPLSPTIRRLYSEGDTVIAVFDAEATTRDGKTYRNTYAWFMEMRDGKIVNVTAFFDAIALNQLWDRVSAQP